MSYTKPGQSVQGTEESQHVDPGRGYPSAWKKSNWRYVRKELEEPSTRRRRSTLKKFPLHQWESTRPEQFGPPSPASGSTTHTTPGINRGPSQDVRMCPSMHDDRIYQIRNREHIHCRTQHQHTHTIKGNRKEEGCTRAWQRIHKPVPKGCLPDIGERAIRDTRPWQKWLLPGRTRRYCYLRNPEYLTPRRSPAEK